MRILIITHEYPPYPGGVGRYCASLADAAVRAGHEVTVLAPDHGQGNLPQVQHGVSVRRFEGDLFHFNRLRAIRQVIAECLAGQTRPFDLVHAADWPAIVAMRRIRTPGTRRLATLHGTDVLLFKQSLRARLARAGTALASFDTLVCNSRYTQSLLGTHFPSLLERSHVTPLGVDSAWFEAASPSAVDAFSGRIGLADGQQMVLTVARLDSRKGQHTAIEALGRLPAALRGKLRYVCVGKEVEAGYSAKLQALADQHQVRLTLTGRLPDDELKAAYGLADVFALTGVSVPGKVEGFGLVLLEAAAQGLPSVVTKVQALPEVVIAAQTGWVADTPGELAEAFGEALGSGRRAQFRAACLEQAHRHSWDACCALTYPIAP